MEQLVEKHYCRCLFRMYPDQLLYLAAIRFKAVTVQDMHLCYQYIKLACYHAINSVKLFFPHIASTNILLFILLASAHKLCFQFSYGNYENRC